MVSRFVLRSLSHHSQTLSRAVFDGGSGEFDPPQEVADSPPESSAEPLWGGSILTPLRTPPPIPFSC